MSKKSDIAILKKVEKRIYNRRRYLVKKYGKEIPKRCPTCDTGAAAWGCKEAEAIIYNLRFDLENK